MRMTAKRCAKFFENEGSFLLTERATNAKGP
jgi:hypothetical protein